MHNGNAKYISMSKKSFIFDACRAGNVSVLEKHLGENADVNIRNGLGQTPLHIACKYGRVEVVKFLLGYGVGMQKHATLSADLDAMDENKWTPFQYANYYGHRNVIKILLEHGEKLVAAKKCEQSEQSVSSEYSK